MSINDPNQYSSELYTYETPFADEVEQKTGENVNENKDYDIATAQYSGEFESPFLNTYENLSNAVPGSNAYAPEYVGLLAELEDSELENYLYNLAGELEDVLGNKISNEFAMGEAAVPYITQQANEYFSPLALEAETAIDKINEHYSNRTFNDLNELEMENFFNSLINEQHNLTPAQEQFFGSIIKKAKNVVKKGIEIAKQGAKLAGKFLPLGIILNKLKGLIKPLLGRVLKFATGKLPKNLQPYALSLAKKFLNLETVPLTGYTGQDNNETPSSGDLKGVSSEFDHMITNLVYAETEEEANIAVSNYTAPQEFNVLEQETQSYGIGNQNLDTARAQLITDLKNLKQGESSAPALERFLPVAMMALKPVIRMALNALGRKKIIDFLAGFLAKLLDKYVPQQVAQPLAASIINAGLNVIGFETYERTNSDVAYEALVNTVEEVVNNLNAINENTLNNNESLAQHVFESFENSVPLFFNSSSLRPNL